jgi:ribokinase
MIITCVGDCGIDYYTDLAVSRSGGIALNLAVHARSLFPKEDVVEIVSAIGTDSESDLVRQTIEKYGIKSYLSTLEGQTPVQYINLDNNGEKVFTKYEEEVLSDYVIAKEQKVAIEKSDLVMTVLFSQIEILFESVMACTPTGLVSVDFMDLSDYEKNTDIVEKYIKHFDIAFFGLQKEDTEVIAKLKEIAKTNKKIFVITLGSQGSLAQDNDALYTEAAVSISDLRDTTGAGDAFAAAFMKTYLYTKDVALSLKIGNNYAADVVQKIGSF